jgi:plastocyanin
MRGSRLFDWPCFALLLATSFFFSPMKLAPRFGLCATALGLWVPVQAATVQVHVLDGTGKPLTDAVVFLESKDAKAAVKPARETAIAQVGKEFTPRVTVVPVGTAVDFPNRDKVRHHVYSFSPAKNFELKLYAGTPAAPVVFDRAGVAVLGCNIHDNMIAWVVAVETPYYGRSAADGQVQLSGVPEGSYRLRVWHTDLAPGAAPSDQAMDVVASGSAATVRLRESKK